LANVAMARGDWSTAETLISEGRSQLSRIDSPEPRAFLAQLTGTIALQQGRVDEAVASLEEAIAGFRQVGAGSLPWYLGVLARADLVAGDQRALDQTVAETIAAVEALPARSLPRAPSIAQLGINAVRMGDKPAMIRWRAELEPYQGQFHWVLMDRVLGMLSLGIGDLDAALASFIDARNIAARGHILPELLRVEGELGLLSGVPSEQMDSLLSEMRTLKLADADYLQERWRSRSAPKSATPAGLSAREVEVLVLVAGGKTNREIAESLSISEKTVTNHLTHIFTKADLDNRASAAAFALRHGLVS
jgi:DNA-binding CsgD family transcriptional regulator